MKCNGCPDNKDGRCERMVGEQDLECLLRTLIGLGIDILEAIEFQDQDGEEWKHGD